MAQTQQKTECSFIPIVINKFTAKVYMWRNRVPQGALERLELLDAKVSRAVLRGRVGGNTALLLDSMVITSDGHTFGNPKFFAKDEKKLAKAQRRHSKKKKGSKNRAKARLKVARIHARIADRRRDYQHKLSTKLIRENQIVCVESLQVKNMVKNHCLAKAISDVGWSEFVRQLEYKASWYGRTLVKIDKFYPSSKRCFDCGHILDSLTLDIRHWVCPECGVQHDRDINAARNVLAAGLAVSACGETVRPGRAKAQPGTSPRSRKPSK